MTKKFIAGLDTNNEVALKRYMSNCVRKSDNLDKIKRSKSIQSNVPINQSYKQTPKS